MHWYIAKLVYKVIYNNAAHVQQFDEQLRLISAEDELHAFHRARLIGETECSGNITATHVRWQFVDVSEILLVDPANDGAEITSKIIEEDNAEVYIRNTQKKAANLLNKACSLFLL